MSSCLSSMVLAFVRLFVFVARITQPLYYLYYLKEKYKYFTITTHYYHYYILILLYMYYQTHNRYFDIYCHFN